MIGKTLVAAQMAFCLLLLVVAALFTRSFRTLTQTDIGFDREHVLTARVDVRGAGYSPDERQALYRRLVETLQAMPGVQSVSLSANGPLWGSQRISSLSVEGYTPGRDERLRTNEETVTDRYFETMGLKILDGRGFRAEDRAPGARNTIVNATHGAPVLSGAERGGQAMGLRRRDRQGLERHRRRRRGRALRGPEGRAAQHGVRAGRCVARTMC